MFKKNIVLLCALTAAYAPVAANVPDCFREDEIVDLDLAKGKNKKCCRCCSLTVTNNASIGGNLTVGGTGTFGGSVTAASFITASGGPLLNWAVFSNNVAVGNGGIFTWSTTPATSITAGIMNAAGVITLPVGGTFLVQYTARVTVTGPVLAGTFAIVELLQGSTGGGFVNIGQPAVIAMDDVLTTADIVQSQITGYAIVTTTSTANNQIELEALLSPAGTPGYTIPVTGAPDANANMTILQLK